MMLSLLALHSSDKNGEWAQDRPDPGRVQGTRLRAANALGPNLSPSNLSCIASPVQRPYSLMKWSVTSVPWFPCALSCAQCAPVAS